MNIATVLSTGQTKAHAMAIVEYIGTDEHRYLELLKLLDDDDKLIAQRAAWPLMHSAEKYPHLAKAHIMHLIQIAKKPEHHPAVRRVVTRILDHSDLDEDEEGHAFELCHKLASSAKKDVAFRLG